jgi:hypothetical protein
MIRPPSRAVGMRLRRRNRTLRRRVLPASTANKTTKTCISVLHTSGAANDLTAIPQKDIKIIKAYVLEDEQPVEPENQAGTEPVAN